MACTEPDVEEVPDDPGSIGSHECDADESVICLVVVDDVSPEVHAMVEE